MSHSPLPWYREPWTWVLIGLPATAVVASLASAVLAVQGADTIVEDDYYQRGLHINSTLQRLHHAAELGVHAAVEYDGFERGAAVWVRVRSSEPLHDTTLQVRMIHPTRAMADRFAILGRVPNTPDTAAEFTGAWDEAATQSVPAGAAARAINWRIALDAQDWQLQGDAGGRGDLHAR